MDCTVGKIEEIMNSIAPEDWAEEWDNVGLMLGRRDAKIKRVMTAVDITLPVIQEAIDKKVDMIIAHHPLIFKPVTKLDDSSIGGQLIYLLLENRIAVYCAHTNLDKAPEGTDDSLAQTLELENIRFLIQDDGGANLPEIWEFGRVGEISQPMGIREYAIKVQKQLKASHVSIIGDQRKEIQTVAVCGGAGAGLMSHARKAGADILVTGEIKYHDAMEASFSDMPILVAGHFYTELPVMMRLIGRLQKTLNGLQYNIEVIPSILQKSPYIPIVE